MASKAGPRVAIVGAIAAVAIMFYGAAYAVQTNVELIIDSSGSMAKRLDGKSKMDTAKSVLLDLVSDLPADARIAVRTYGGRRKNDCEDLQLIAPFGSNDRIRIESPVNRLQPVGMTPIASSLQLAADDFGTFEGQHNVLILVTDGEETCHGDPCAAAKAVHEAGIHLEVNVIGFNVSPKETEQLKCIAKAGGGKYYDAANASEFKVAASEVTEHIASAPTAPAATENNLLAPNQGGELLFAPDPSWTNMVNGSGIAVVAHQGDEGIFGFKDGEAATFSKFEIRIPDKGPWNIKDFELFVADDSPNGSFRSLGTFRAYNGRAMKSEYQEFTFPETTAKYFKVKFLTYAEGLASSISIYGIRLVGKRAAKASAANAAPGATAAVPEINLLAPAQGSKLIVAKDPSWANMVDGNHSPVVVHPGDEAVFQFKGEMPATFFKFEIKIPEKRPWNLGEFELLVGDDSPTGSFRSLGTFKTYNGLALASPYQKFTFPETTARYFKVRFLTYSEGLASSMSIYGIRLVGRVVQPAKPKS